MCFFQTPDILPSVNHFLSIPYGSSLHQSGPPRSRHQVWMSKQETFRRKLQWRIEREEIHSENLHFRPRWRFGIYKREREGIIGWKGPQSTGQFWESQLDQWWGWGSAQNSQSPLEESIRPPHWARSLAGSSPVKMWPGLNEAANPKKQQMQALSQLCSLQ